MKKFQTSLYLSSFIFIGIAQGIYTPCGKTLSSPEGLIISNRSSVQCKWTISSGVQSEKVQLQFINPINMGESQDYIQATEAITTINNFNKPTSDRRRTIFKETGPILTTSKFESVGNPVLIEILSNDDKTWLDFTLSYKIIETEPRCVQNKKEISHNGALVSSNIKDSKCSWFIKPKNINFDYIVIYFTMDSNCTGEKFKFYDNTSLDMELNCEQKSSIPEPIYIFGISFSAQYEKIAYQPSRLHAHYKALKYKKYEESCSSSINTQNYPLCSPYKMQTCQEGICSCYLSHDQMFYSQNDEICVSKLKSQCHFPQGILKGLDVKANCANNTKCSENGYCECVKSHYFENIEVENCEVKKYFGQKCSLDIECDQKLSLICVQGQCGCDLTSGRFIDENLVECVGQLNEPCVNQKCLSNGQCNIFGICECSGGFTKSSNNSCHRDYGEICDESRPCSDFQFYCVNGFCRCKNSQRTRYIGNMKKCLSKLYGNCKNNGDCLVNMVCAVKSRSTYLHKQCLCSEGFVQDDFGNCNPSFGSVCLNTEIIESGFTCGQNLFCINSRCGCFDDLHIFNLAQKKCLGDVGAICESHEDCNELTICQKDWEFLKFGRCEQKNKYTGINHGTSDISDELDDRKIFTNLTNSSIEIGPEFTDLNKADSESNYHYNNNPEPTSTSTKSNSFNYILTSLMLAILL